MDSTGNIVNQQDQDRSTSVSQQIQRASERASEREREREREKRGLTSYKVKSPV